MVVVWIALSVAGPAALVGFLFRSWPKGFVGPVANRLKLSIVGCSLALAGVPLIVVATIFFGPLPWPAVAIFGVCLVGILWEGIRLSWRYRQMHKDSTE